MHPRTTILAALLLAASSAFAQSIVVPGTSDLWLAGAPNGTTASGGDLAPAQSPALISGISGGSFYSFSVTGWVNNSPGASSGPGPDGDIGQVITHSAGAQNGISNLTAPINSLIGVFTTGEQPSSPGAYLVFGDAASLNFDSIAPTLNQAFFIGNGLTSSAQLQTFLAPTGASRLYLGTMDGYEWSNNSGEFNVTATAIPEPSTYAAFCGIAALAIVVIRRWRK